MEGRPVLRLEYGLVFMKNVWEDTLVEIKPVQFSVFDVQYGDFSLTGHEAVRLTREVIGNG